MRPTTTCCLLLAISALIITSIVSHKFLNLIQSNFRGFSSKMLALRLDAEILKLKRVLASNYGMGSLRLLSNFLVRSSWPRRAIIRCCGKASCLTQVAKNRTTDTSTRSTRRTSPTSTTKLPVTKTLAKIYVTSTSTPIVVTDVLVESTGLQMKKSLFVG